MKAREWLGVILVHVSIPLTLFACAGEIGWWQGWLFSGLLFAAGVGGRSWAEARHPGLMAERYHSMSAGDVKTWDKVLAPLMAISLSFPLVIVAGLDHRFEWSTQYPLWIHVVGVLFIAIGYAFGAWALAENQFFSSMVRIQKDRGHTVCDTGPYGIVRHPGYAGGILAMIGVVMALNSTWTLIPVGFGLVVSLVRTKLEDDTLLEELDGYETYANNVKFRLFPGVY